MRSLFFIPACRLMNEKKVNPSINIPVVFLRLEAFVKGENN